MRKGVVKKKRVRAAQRLYLVPKEKLSREESSNDRRPKITYPRARMNNLVIILT